MDLFSARYKILMLNVSLLLFKNIYYVVKDNKILSPEGTA